MSDTKQVARTGAEQEQQRAVLPAVDVFEAWRRRLSWICQ